MSRRRRRSRGVVMFLKISVIIIKNILSVLKIMEVSLRTGLVHHLLAELAPAL